MARQADWYFDVISPYAYLQFHELKRLPDDIEITFRPVLFAALLNHWGQLGPAEIPLKKVHTAMITAWRARARSIVFKPPPRHPFNPLKLLRLIIALGATRDVVGKVFAHVWGEGNDGEAPDSLARLAADLGVDDFDAAVGAEAVKTQLRSNTENAIAQGVYGVPTLAIDGKLFWGEEMFDILLSWLDDPAVL